MTWLIGLEGMVEVPPDALQKLVKWGYAVEMTPDLYEITDLGRLYLTAAKRQRERETA